MTAGQMPAVENWPDLVPLDVPDLPKLSPRHLPGWAGDFAEALSQATETPPALTTGMVLAACAAAAARRLQVCARPDYLEPCNLWIIVALAPGIRKSAVQARSTAPLHAWEKGQAKQLESEILRAESDVETMQARIKELRRPHEFDW